MIRLIPACIAVALCIGVLLLSGCARPEKRRFWAEFIEDMDRSASHER